MSKFAWLFAVLFSTIVASSSPSFAQTAPPAPVLVAPANGAPSLQPITLRWNAIVDPDGPIGSYSWQVSTTSTFGSVIASGFNNLGDPSIPLPTDAQFSGLANGTYFWRVKGAQDVGGAIGFIDSAWSAPRNFTVTGLGPAPAGIPILTSPSGASFHPYEFFDLVWTEVAGASYYLLEADSDFAFSHPIQFSGGPTMVFGTKFNAGWGNEIPNIFYRVRAVSADNVWGRPSATVTVHITNAAPVPPAPTPLFPINNASVQLPIRFDWTDTPNPQIAGYDIDIDDEPNFLGTVGVLMVMQISRSDYMVVPDPLVTGTNVLPPGTYYWRVRAVHGSVYGPWSAGKQFTVGALPPTPPNLGLFWILADPGTAYGGNPTAARIALNSPAPAGGVTVHLASDFPGVEIPPTAFIPAGSTDAVIAPVTTPSVPGMSVGTLRAAYGMGWQQSSIGCAPTLWGGWLTDERIVGGNNLSGTVTLLGPAPAGGVDVAIVSSNTALARPPASVHVPAGATSATFGVTTSAVSIPTQINFSFGTPFENYRAPGGAFLVLNPASSPTPPAALSSISLSPSTLLGGSSGTGTVTLTSPAPAGGALIRLNGSSEGDSIVPASVTIPAGSLSASFPITPGPVVRSHWVLIDAWYWPSGQSHALTLRVDPGPPGPSPLYAIDVRPMQLVGGTPSIGTVGLATPAPPGGMSVALSSSNPSEAHVPPSVLVAAGNSTASFTITTNAATAGSSAEITGTAGGVSKSGWLYIGPNPNTPLQLASISPSISAVVGGSPINTTVFLNHEAPAGGAVVTLSSSQPSAVQVPASVTVPAGLTFVTFNMTTSPVTSNTPVTITGTFGVSQSTVVTVMAPPVSITSLALSPSSVVGGSPSTGTVVLSAVAPAGGTAVSLTSSNPTIASVPVRVTVAAGATSATFSVTTTIVASNTSATITASAGGASRTATLSITPSATGFRSPTAHAADTGGDGNGFETGGANALTDDAASAVDNNGGTASTSSCTSTARDRHRFWSFGLTVPAGASVNGIEVRLDARADSTSGAPKMCVELSSDGGATWTGPKSTPTLTTGMSTYVLGATTDTWGRAWTAADVSNASFRVRVANVASATARDFSLDWIAVRLTTGTGTVTPDSTPPSVALASPSGGASVSGTTTISANASDNVGVTRVEFYTDGVLLSTDITAPYSASWNTAATTNGAHSLTARAFDAAANQTASTPVGITVSNGGAPALDLALSGVPATIRRGEKFTARGTAANSGASAASGYTVRVTFTPTDSMRLENPQSATQTVASVAPGATQSVSWLIRAEREGTATLTMTLRDTNGATIDTAVQTLTITN